MILPARPPLALTHHDDSPMTCELALWLSYHPGGGIGEVVARHRTARTNIQHEPPRWHLTRDAVGSAEEAA